MKASIVMMLVGAAATPVAIHEVGGAVDPAAFANNTDLLSKAQEIAEKDFSTSAKLSVVGVTISDSRTGAFGERIRPDPGYAFHVMKVRIENTGKLDIAVSSYQFSGIDDANSTHGIEMGGAHDDFNAARLGHGQARNGEITFQLRKGEFLTGASWQGDLGEEANATAPAYEHP